MKKSIILALGILLAAGLAAAQDHHFSVYLGGGVGVPMSSELKDTWKAGAVYEIGIGYVLQPNLEIFAKFSSSHFRPDKDNFVDVMFNYLLEQTGEDHNINNMSFGGGGDINYYSIVAGAKYYIPAVQSGGVFNPYFIGSAGLTKQRIVDPELVFYEDLLYLKLNMGSDEFGFLGNAGAGIDFNFGSGFNIFVEGKYALHFVDPENTQSFPLTAGFKIALGGLE